MELEDKETTTLRRTHSHGQMESSTSTTTTSTSVVAPTSQRGWLGSIYDITTSLISGLFNPFANEMDPVTQSRRLLTELELAFGDVHPNIITDSYSRACSRAKSEYKFLIIYLHSPLHPDTATFCRDTLFTQMVADFINDNFLFWAGSVSNSEGFRVSNILGAVGYPFLGVICNNTIGGMTILDRIVGKISAEDLMSRITTVLEQHGHVLVQARLDNEERDTNRRLREEQDRAFMQSLIEDQEKEQKLREEQRRQAELEEQMRAEEEARKQKEASRLNRRETLKQRIRSEPEAADNVTQLVIRLPDGSRLQRRFLITDTIQEVLDFIDSRDEVNLSDYELVTHFPRKSFSDASRTLKEEGLYPHAALYAVEK